MNQKSGAARHPSGQGFTEKQGQYLAFIYTYSHMFRPLKDPMIVTNARFLAGWAALVQVLGQPRTVAIAAALGVTVP